MKSVSVSSVLKEMFNPTSPHRSVGSCSLGAVVSRSYMLEFQTNEKHKLDYSIPLMFELAEQASKVSEEGVSMFVGGICSS